MAKNYKHELDKQWARQQTKPQDLLDNYEFDPNILIHNESTQAFPIYQNGTFVRDAQYDKEIQKFIARDFVIDQNYKKEMYDENAFKRRNLHSKMVKFFIGKITNNFRNKLTTNYKKYNNETEMRHSQSQGNDITLKCIENYGRVDWAVTPNKINQKIQPITAKKPSGFKLREKIFSKRNARQGKTQEDGSNKIGSRIASRDDRLKAPKSSQSSMNRSFKKSSFDNKKEKIFKNTQKNITFPVKNAK